MAAVPKRYRACQAALGDKAVLEQRVQELEERAGNVRAATLACCQQPPAHCRVQGADAAHEQRAADWQVERRQLEDARLHAEQEAERYGHVLSKPRSAPLTQRRAASQPE